MCRLPPGLSHSQFSPNLPAAAPLCRPFKLTFAFMVAGAGANAVLYFLQLRYHATDLSVLPPEGLWQQALRTVFGARPPRGASKAGDQGEQPGLPPPVPAVLPRPAPPSSVEELEQQQQRQAAVAAAERASTVPASPPAAGTPTQFTASPTSSFVDITTVPSPVQLQLGAGEGAAGPSIEEGWTQVGRSGQETPQQQGSPTAAAAAYAAQGQGQEQAGECEAAAAAAAAAQLSFEHVGRAGAGEQ